jgi:hypothetical protein
MERNDYGRHPIFLDTDSDPQQPDRYVPRIHAAYWPTLNNRVHEPITFKVRSFGNQDGGEVWDFDRILGIRQHGKQKTPSTEGRVALSILRGPTRFMGDVSGPASSGSGRCEFCESAQAVVLLNTE